MIMDIQNEIANKIDRPIVLVGMMGSGKSYVGERLAEMLGFPFYDSDTLIEAEQGNTIASIFENKGEPYFRKLELEKIISLLDSRKPCIISTGGGAVINPTILNAIKEYAFSIWLMADIPTILKRLDEDKKRPLMQVEDKAARLQELLRVRRPLYALADIKIDNNDVEKDELTLRLYKALYEFLNLR
jgi:shikimate kinase